MAWGVIWLLMNIFVRGSNASAEATADEIATLLKDAQTSFEKQEFIASYEAYRKVLAIDPMHQAAREKIYEIVTIYKTLEETARAANDEERADMFQRQHRTIIKEMLNIFTLQLEKQLTIYTDLKAKAKQGDDVQKQITTELEYIITTLQQLKYMYVEFPREPAKAEKMVERIDKTLTAYQNELATYKK
ncbi:hypothetical protein U14_02202 [Candidatus Moduliflexus flocculans]|uniref:Uncharacterized protein n=1 Tax=Candidatus Moduliflexus flocculans TaxID=1499966 RepID=A0A0S6VU21_9BACT|nr:hypothetical protein U14_02202 [Candidatus Moduliflexus flocculans]